ncbi:MAG: right-handed parallel beta-helix repeat-containing protein [Patescibacteria group bacterium]
MKKISRATKKQKQVEPIANWVNQSGPKLLAAFMVVVGVTLFGAVAALAIVFPTSLKVDGVAKPTTTTTTAKQFPLADFSADYKTTLAAPSATASAKLAPITPVLGGKVIYVDNSARGAKNGKTWANAYTSLNDALIELKNMAGVTIEIAQGSGMYVENFTTGPDSYGCALGVDDSGTGPETTNVIKAKFGEQPVLKCLKGNGFRTVGTKWLAIDGLTLYREPYAGSGLEIRDGENILLTNVKILGARNSGLALTHSTQVQVTNSLIQGALHGVSVWESSDNTFTGNTISNNRCTGMYVYGANTNTFSNNLIYSNGYECGVLDYFVGGVGVRLQQSNNNRFILNTIDNHPAGGWYYEGQWYDTNGRGIIALAGSTNNLVQDSIISNNPLGGLYAEAGLDIPTTYTNVWQVNAGLPTAASIGNASADPLFENAAAGNYHLKCDSPSRNAGTPGASYANEPAPNGGRVDQGHEGNTPKAAKCPTVKNLIPIEIAD